MKKCKLYFEQLDVEHARASYICAHDTRFEFQNSYESPAKNSGRSKYYTFAFNKSRHINHATFTALCRWSQTDATFWFTPKHIVQRTLVTRDIHIELETSCWISHQNEPNSQRSIQIDNDQIVWCMFGMRRYKLKCVHLDTYVYGFWGRSIHKPCIVIERLRSFSLPIVHLIQTHQQHTRTEHMMMKSNGIGTPSPTQYQP